MICRVNTFDWFFETEMHNQEPTHYRFVAPGGKATSWRRIPTRGIMGQQYARARRDLGEKFALEMCLRLPSGATRGVMHVDD